MTARGGVNQIQHVVNAAGRATLNILSAVKRRDEGLVQPGQKRVG